MPARADEHIRAKCFHSTGTFIEFKREEIEQSIPERFEKIARLYPDRLAVKVKDKSLTYAKLNKGASKVADEILSTCDNSEKPVALLLKKNIPLFVALLGVLKAKSIYVPIDVSLPVSRINSILEDSQAETIVTSTPYVDWVNEVQQHKRLVLNIDNVVSSPFHKKFSPRPLPDSAACILYTSGSTGQPKGVIHTHRTMLHAAMLTTNNFHLCAEDRVALLVSSVFSGSIKYIFGALLNGALLLPFDINEEGMIPLASWLDEEKITICDFVATAFRHFAGSLAGEEAFPRLRLICLGSESIAKQDVELYRQRFTDQSILVVTMAANETGSMRLHFIDKTTEITESVVPVGYEIEDKEILLLDDAGNRLMFNSVGEIAVRSRYLSPGYWRRPDLTKATFLPDPDGGDARIYLTGDLGRMGPDGCLHYLGRKDLVAKIRGYGVEVTQIEMALLEHPSIEQTAVVPREEHNGDTRLVAYIVPRKLPAPSAGAVRIFLKDKLPHYMIPSTFVVLRSLPLTPTGKLDRQALPAPGNARPALDMAYVAPRSPVEAELAKIWAEVLSLDQVGIHDNFFDLGGHSLAVTWVVARVFQRFQLEIPLKLLFQSPTVAEMAKLITEHQGKMLGEKEIGQLLTELESLSEEEAQKRLRVRSSSVVKNE
jgi:amino acid adenylation domain-containing protein